MFNSARLRLCYRVIPHRYRTFFTFHSCMTWHSREATTTTINSSSLVLKHTSHLHSWINQTDDGRCISLPYAETMRGIHSSSLFHASFDIPAQRMRSECGTVQLARPIFFAARSPKQYFMACSSHSPKLPRCALRSAFFFEAENNRMVGQRSLVSANL